MAYREFKCPSCGASLLCSTENNSETVICEFCNSEWNIKDLENRPAYIPEYAGADSGNLSAKDAVAVAYIDDSESAMAFLENYLENYEWNDFIMTSALTIPTLDKIVEKLVIKQGASAATWRLQFTAISEPIIRKISGLRTLESRFFEEFSKTGDSTDGIAYFDAYKIVAQKLSSSAESITKKLANAIKYYEKYISNGGNEGELNAMTVQLEHIKADLERVQTVKSYTDLPTYDSAQEEYRRLIEEKLAQKGIKAEDVYSRAVFGYNSGHDRRAILAAFQSIAGYKDADEYIDKLNTLFEFEYSEKAANLVRLGNKYYVYRVPKVEAFNPLATGQDNVQPAAPATNNNKKGCGKKKKDAPVAEAKAADVFGSYSLYEIVNTEEQKRPSVSGITCFLRNRNAKTGEHELAHYGDFLVYVKNNTQLCIFDSNAPAGMPAETVVFTGKPGDFEYANSKMWFFIKGKHFYFTKKLQAITEQKKGCFASMFKKNKVEKVISNKNNFSLISFDMSTGETKTVVPELVTVTEIMDNHVFYILSTSVDGKEQEDFYAYNMENGTSQKVLDANTQIVDVVDGKIIYFLFMPNQLNRDMYAYDFATGEKHLIDSNVYEYYKTINGKLYYRVGNEDYNTLYSITTEGTEKTEIIQNARRLGYAKLRNGWLYLQRGRGLNAVLSKINAEGGNEVVVCPHFKRLVSFSDGYVYYINTVNSLCVVREDGMGNEVVLSDVGEVLNITPDAIYLLKNEHVGVVDVSNVSYKSKSLYKVDIDGHNLTKIAFDVSSAKVNSYNEDEIYLYRTVIKRYKISTPRDESNYDITYENYCINSIVLYNTVENTFTDVAVFGKPELGASRTFKKGCFGRKQVVKDCIIEEVPHKIEYVRKGMVKAGAVGEEQLDNANKQQNQQTAPNSTNAGCGSKKTPKDKNTTANANAKKGCGSK